MMFKTHLVFGFLVALFVLDYFQVKNKYYFIFFVCLGAIFTDIDNLYSKVGKIFRPITWLIHLLFGHRGFFHTLTAAVLIFILFYIFNYKLEGFAFFIGYISHLLIDCLNFAGVKLFKPFSNMHIRGFVKTNSITEYFLFAILILVIVVKIYNWFV